MNTSFCFQVGDLTCLAVADGSRDYLTASLFADVPKEAYELALERHGQAYEEITIPYICLAVEVRGEWVLVDTGAGHREETNVGQLPANLAAAGVDPSQITLVVLTHGHTDHISGLTRRDGTLTYSNARYVMAQAEWAFWRESDNLRAIGWEGVIPPMEKNLGAIEGRVEFIQAEHEVVPGVRVLPAQGHTPGHMVVVFTSQGKQLWSTGDALIQPVHLECPDWYTVYDLAPAEALATKRRLLQVLAERDALVHAFHFPFPGIGRVRQKANSWRWRPINEAT